MKSPALGCDTRNRNFITCGSLKRTAMSILYGSGILILLTRKNYTRWINVYSNIWALGLWLLWSHPCRKRTKKLISSDGITTNDIGESLKLKKWSLRWSLNKDLILIFTTLFILEGLLHIPIKENWSKSHST